MLCIGSECCNATFDVANTKQLIIKNKKERPRERVSAAEGGRKV
jgi:hypothetical protein